jgi:hypothetical protein
MTEKKEGRNDILSVIVFLLRHCEEAQADEVINSFYIIASLSVIARSFSDVAIQRNYK